MGSGIFFRTTWLISTALCGCLMMNACAPGLNAGDREPEALVQAPAEPGPREVFLDTCSGCHSVARAYHALGNRTEWVQTVASMAIKDRRRITPQTMRIVISYYEVHRGLLHALFRDKCGRCHRRSEFAGRERSASQWKTYITFMGERRAGGLTGDERAMLLGDFAHQ